MNSYSRNTILYSILTVSIVSSYWLVRQNSQHLEQPVAQGQIIEINAPASLGYEGPYEAYANGTSSTGREALAGTYDK